MKINLGVAAVIAVGASAAGAGALDSVPFFYGALPDLTRAVLNDCPALHSLGDPLGFEVTGSGGVENAMKASSQLIGPMKRIMGSGICTASGFGQRAGAEGMVIALDALSIVVNDSTAGQEGIDYPGAAGDPANQWRTVLRLVYTGMDPAVGNNVFQRDCDSAARRAIVNNWDNVFHGTATACTDSHPSVPGSGPGAYDQNNAIIEPGIRHAFRRDDESGSTDVLLAQLGLNGVSFAQGAPSGSSAVQVAVYRALAGSPFCNNKRPDDDWQPVGLPANSTLAFNASQIPEMVDVGVPSGAGSGLGLAAFSKGSTNPKLLAPYLNAYSDQDPIRRKCVGRGNNANAALPFEQVCAADGTLGLVLPITIPPEFTTAEQYPALPCEPGKGFFFGPALTRPTTDPVRCPNGDATQDSQCLLPVRSDASQPNGVAFDCINPPGNVPQAVFDTDGNGAQFPDAPGTDGRTDVDGRVYNLILRQPDGTIRTTLRTDPSRLGVFQAPVAAAYYRLHTTRSLLLPPNHASRVCATAGDAGDQLGCLALASPCSIGYGTLPNISNNPGTVAAAINGIESSRTTIQNLVRAGTKFPMARKIYLNSLQGFETLHDSSALVPGTDAEEELAKCFATLPFNGTINVESLAFGFVKLPPAAGASSEKPLCEDFDGSSVCGDLANNDACVGNEAIGGGNIPTSLCDNGLKDGDETGPDQCPALRPTCNPVTHHCQ